MAMLMVYPGFHWAQLLITCSTSWTHSTLVRLRHFQSQPPNSGMLLGVIRFWAGCWVTLRVVDLTASLTPSSPTTIDGPSSHLIKTAGCGVLGWSFPFRCMSKSYRNYTTLILGLTTSSLWPGVTYGGQGWTKPWRILSVPVPSAKLSETTHLLHHSIHSAGLLDHGKGSTSTLRVLYWANPTLLWWMYSRSGLKW